MNFTEKEKEMLKVFYMMENDGECYTCHLCFSRSDNGVLASLCKKGVFVHDGRDGIDASVRLIASIDFESIMNN